MPLWLTIVLALGGSAIITCTVTFAFQRVFYKKAEARDRRKQQEEDAREAEHLKLQSYEKEREREELRKERKADLEEVIAPLIKKIDDLDDKVQKISQGTVADLRNNLLTNFYRCLGRGYKTQDEAENFTDMYKAYRDLDGNSFIEHDIAPGFTKIPLEAVANKNEEKKEA